MKAMILAAGRGERMRPLTDTLPKPLLEVHGKPLILWHLERLVASGFKEVIINIAHLGHKIPKALGDGSNYGISITYSDEQDEGALESAGGIVKALPLLGDEPFLVVNGDVFCDYVFDANFDLGDKLAHLILVPNPEHNLKGDFGLNGTSVLNEDKIKYTFSGIGYYSPKLFNNLEYGKSALSPLLRDAIAKNEVSGELFNNIWHDIGTPQRLEDINK
ncbi:nucleotidyl transferase [Sulfurimonas gotlandica GD1]|uniref:Nucleotidyl transferase n=1 Tax=Sulfurimonas gotlandica (strain DSM 19862 / JCM 16533 / GD1) TaxID=929558 RepID=B6BGC5_SULGG|nr:nucleotidyltransferase family protein [Sulfurimonas gotlandica]EDZ63357.1 nucleotidyl transferase [Sulfurimonas gotlandica GD1]EHP29552.1 nucleotidyl transferase [Sulfurimonas gotlandica GD1]